MKNTYEENQTLEMEFSNPEKFDQILNYPNNQVALMEKGLKIELRNGCSVCGMDEWCGTDGCPLDPQ
jgi:hypothetical protein